MLALVLHSLKHISSALVFFLFASIIKTSILLIANNVQASARVREKKRNVRLSQPKQLHVFFVISLRRSHILRLQRKCNIVNIIHIDNAFYLVVNYLCFFFCCSTYNNMLSLWLVCFDQIA